MGLRDVGSADDSDNARQVGLTQCRTRFSVCKTDRCDIYIFLFIYLLFLPFSKFYSNCTVALREGNLRTDGGDRAFLFL